MDSFSRVFWVVAAVVGFALAVVLAPRETELVADCRARGGSPVWRGSIVGRMYNGCAEGRR